DALQPLLKSSDGPPGELGPLTARAKGDPRQAYDIGFLRRHGQEPQPVPPNKQRGMRALHGEELELVPRHMIVLTDKRDRLPGKQPLDKPYGSGEAFDPSPTRVKADPELVVLRLHKPRPQAELRRPSVKRSTVAASRATSTGCRKSLFSTWVPIRRCVVAS